jgi:signal transduction histidine kinase
VQQVVDEQRLHLHSQCTLVLNVTGVLPEVNADPNRIQQVLANVIQNIVKYSPAGGVVEVGIRWQDCGVLVSVADKGIGLPQIRHRIEKPCAHGRKTTLTGRSNLPGRRG